MHGWPNELFVAPEEVDRGEIYWNAQESTDKHAMVGSAVEVGVYRLVRTVKVKTAVVVEVPEKNKKKRG